MTDRETPTPTDAEPLEVRRSIWSALASAAILHQDFGACNFVLPPTQADTESPSDESTVIK